VTEKLKDQLCTATLFFRLSDAMTKRPQEDLVAVGIGAKRRERSEHATQFDF
jgi:hypothetical protein